MRYVKNIGEQGIIRKIQKKFSYRRNRRIVIGNGDDACAVKIRPGKVLVATTDMLIEGTHFSSSWNRWEDIGYKALAVSISDCAAMGGVRPLCGLVSIGLKPDTPVYIVDRILTGLHVCAQKADIMILGGDTVRVQKHIVISVCLMGEADRGDLVERAGAQVGDKLLITGHMGMSRAGLSILKKRNAQRTYGSKSFQSRLVDAHLRPPDRTGIAQWMGKRHLASSMIDSSDGLYPSLEQLAAASGVGFVVFLDEMPCDRHLQQWCRRFKKDPCQVMVFGGEDYELVFTAAPKNARIICDRYSLARVIGEVTAKRTDIILRRKNKIPVKRKYMFKHF